METLEKRLSRLSPERRAKIEARTDELHREYVGLRALRERLGLSQTELAGRVGVKQAEISKLERGNRRLTIATLDKIVSAVGGAWELTVRLPGGEALSLLSSADYAEVSVESVPPAACQNSRES